jgi:PHP family Zn ribbon phosphoesterase
MLKINIPSFTEMPAFTDELVDELGAIKQHIDELEAAARKLKAELIRRGVGTYEGSKFFAEVQHYDRATISPTLVRKMVSPEIVTLVTEVKPVDAVVVKPLND